MTKRDYGFASEEFHKFSNALYEIKQKASWYYEETYDDDTLREMLRFFGDSATRVYNLSNRIENYVTTILHQMKLKYIDFRVWSKLENGYIEYPALALGSVLPTKVHRANRAIPFIEFDERDDEKEVEFWTGLRDLNNTKIYEGDIVGHYAEGVGVEYYSEIAFNQEKGVFEFICIEHPVIKTFDELANTNIEVVGNIHELAD